MKTASYSFERWLQPEEIAEWFIKIIFDEGIAVTKIKDAGVPVKVTITIQEIKKDKP